MHTLTYYSTVKADVLKKSLFWGTLKATLGLLVMFFGGPFLFIPGVLLIGWGLIPYRKLKKLENNPYTIHLTETHLILRTKKSTAISLNEIEKMEYVDGMPFGILITTKERTLFAPYFSKRTFTDLTELDRAS